MGELLVFRHGCGLNIGFGWQRANDHVVRRQSKIHERSIELDGRVETEIQSEQADEHHETCKKKFQSDWV